MSRLDRLGFWIDDWMLRVMAMRLERAQRNYDSMREYWIRQRARARTT